MAVSISRPAGGRSSISVVGNGLVSHQDGMLRGQSLIGGPGIGIRNADGREGKPVISAITQAAIGKALAVPCDVLTETVIPIVGPTLYTISHIIFCNATPGAPVELRAGVSTLTGMSGDILIADTQSFTLAAERYASQRVSVAAGMDGVRAAPFLYFKPSVANASPLFIDIYVIGETLELAE